MFELATELANTSPTDPRTLTRAARDFAQKQPAFAMAAGMAALYWISQGYGYEITGCAYSMQAVPPCRPPITPVSIPKPSGRRSAS
ncbi:hypothetical protein [Cupriavidus pinatubonensis]|uniref:hypothetical protein n=1 Tax=Cupriavidus pinatubonensis TaxID=248026 RepID=UPI0035932796